jgi:hypothetical protein
MKKSLIRRVALSLPLVVLFLCWNNLFANMNPPATIIDIPGGCAGTAEETNLTAALSTAGYTVTLVTGAVPGSLIGQKQVWDIRCQTALSPSDITTYTAYLASGGSLFVMGENLGYAAARDASIVTFIQGLGGGNLTVTSSQNQQTAQPPFTGPTPLSIVNFRAIGGTSTPGTGAYATKDMNNVGGSLVFGPGSLSAAATGTLIIVFDVNFLDANRSAGETALTTNLIAYLAAPVPVVATPAPPTVILLLVGLGAAAAIQMRRKARAFA